MDQLFLDAGIEAGRLEFVPCVGPAEYFRYYHRVDLCLDPMPYPGHTGCLDALWMGVPSVTLSGRTAAARGGVSILSNVGLSELMAHSTQQYVDIAHKWAGDFARLGRAPRQIPRSDVGFAPDGRQTICGRHRSGVSADVAGLLRRMIRVEPARIRFGDFLSPRQELEQFRQAKVTVECCVPLRRHGHRRRIVDGHARY